MLPTRREEGFFAHLHATRGFYFVINSRVSILTPGLRKTARVKRLAEEQNTDTTTQRL